MTSQNELAYVKVSIDESANTLKNSMINDSYYKSLDNKISSVKIRKFQKVVANYDIRNSDVYSSAQNFNYTVVFEEGENQITADYNQDGKIVHCSELFKNIKLPLSISSEIAKNYPGWEFKNVLCSVTYDIDDSQQVIYKVEIKNGNKRKTLKLNAEDYNL